MTKRERRYTLDANILIYAIDSKAGEKHQKAIDIVDKAIFSKFHIDITSVIDVQKNNFRKTCQV